MRVGFSIVAGAVAGAIASVVLCFGYHAAHVDMVTRQSTHGVLIASDHEALLMLTAATSAPGASSEACEDTLTTTCASVDDLQAIASALESSDRDWMISIMLLRLEVTAPDATSPDPRIEVTSHVPNAVRAYVADGWEPPLVEGATPRASDEVAINADLAARLGVAVGDVVVIGPREPSTSAGPESFTVTGLIPVAESIPPFAATAMDLGLGGVLVVVSPDAVPRLIADAPPTAIADVMWSGDVGAVTSVVPDVKVTEGQNLPQGIIYQGDRWLAVALSAAIAGLIAWGVAVRRRRVSWWAETIGLAAPSAAAVALVMAAAWLHTQWVHAVAPHMMTLNPLAPPVPWTVTAIASGIAISAAGAAWRLTRLQHHEVVDVDELARVVLP